MSDEILKPTEEVVTGSTIDSATEPVLEPALISDTNDQTPETKTIEPVTVESTPVGPTVVVPEPVDEIFKSNSIQQIPIPIATEPTQAPNTTQQEATPRPYSLDPKLNKMIEAFVRGMNRSKENLVLAQKAVKAKMMKKVYKIMDLFKKKQKIKNDDVEKFLHTDDTTATKYLNILTKEGKVKREGENNKTYYTKVE